MRKERKVTKRRVRAIEARRKRKKRDNERNTDWRIEEICQSNK